MFAGVTCAVCLTLLVSAVFCAGSQLDLWYAFAWLAFFGTALGALIYALIRWRAWPRNIQPLAICLSTALLICIIPFDRFARRIEFNRNQEEWERIVARVQKDSLAAASKPSGLGVMAPHLGWYDPKVAVQESDGHRFIFLYTYQSSDTWQGVLFVPEGADPAQFQPKIRHKRDRLNERWYYLHY